MEAQRTRQAQGGRPIKALTLYQPWASLVAMGVKTIETRSSATSFRGQLAIHAAQGQPVQASRLGDYVIGWEYAPPSHPILFHQPVGSPWPSLPDNKGCDRSRCEIYDLPLGAVVAICELVDVVPIVEERGCATAAPSPDGNLITVSRDGEYITWFRHRLTNKECTDGLLKSQRPYNDFTPGRFAWLLKDVKALDEPVPAKGRYGLWEWTPKEDSRERSGGRKPRGPG